MSRMSSGGFNLGMPSIGRVTKGLLALYVGLSIVNALFSIAEPMALIPRDVLHGQVWRLVTYPWLAGDPLSLVINVLMLVFFAAPLEMMWGERRFMWRVGAFVVVPAVIAVAFSLVFHGLLITPTIGLSALMYGLVAAFAGERRGDKFMMFPLPIELSGDGMLALDGGYLALSVLFGFNHEGFWPYFVSIVSFAMAIVWFRISFTRDLRRVWLQLRRRQLEARMARLKAQRNLRVVSSDDDDDEGEPRRFLH